MSILDPGARPGHAGSDAAQRGPHPGTPTTLTASRLNVTAILNAAELFAAMAPKDKPCITMRIRLPDRMLIAEIAAKALRKAEIAIREAGADNIALVLQGRLIAGDVIAEAGLSVQRKSANPPQTP
jgi:hypothetical protein